MGDEINYCTLYLVRHGETESNKNHIIMGNEGDAPLTPEGMEQVRSTAEGLRHVNFDAIFSSDSPRAVRSAEIIRLDRQLAIQTQRLLRERKYGRFEGRSSTEFQEAVRQLLAQKESLTEAEQWKFKFSEDMESDEEVVTRFITQLREVAAAYLGKTVLVATHGGCIRTFLMKVGWARYGQLRGGAFQNAGHVKVLSDGLDFFVQDVQGVDQGTLKRAE